MKKKILIVSHALELGGAERSLIGLLEAFDYQMYEVDLFLLRHEGELLQDVPKEVNLLPQISEYTVLARPMLQILKEGHILLTLARLFGKFNAACYNKKNKFTTESNVMLEYSHKYTYKFMPDIQPHVNYDLAISFLTPHYIVAHKVRATKKVAWIHTDYSKVKINRLSEEKMWDTYDNIVSISNSVSDSFIKTFPKLKNKIILIENILPEQMVRKQANEVDVSKEMDEGKIKILSIGRYSYQKNFDNVPAICKKIIAAGFDVRWYLIGYGPDEALIRKRIRELQVEGKVVLLGKKQNPYPYLKNCDIYIQPSRYEGKSVTVREAQMLAKPVIISNYKTAESQLEDGVDGIIVPMDNNNCAKRIIEILKDQQLLKRLEVNCGSRDYSNLSEIKKVYSLLDP